MQEQAREIVRDYFNANVEKTDGFAISIDDVYVVWFAKTLQNWKALLSTTVSDGMYYEVTFNGDKGEAYLDAYKKFSNQAIQLSEGRLRLDLVNYGEWLDGEGIIRPETDGDKRSHDDLASEFLRTR